MSSPEEAAPRPGEDPPGVLARLRRRPFVRALLGSLGALSGATGVLVGHRLWGRRDPPETAPAGQSPVRPPGARREPEFLARCIGCYLCGEVCPPACVAFPSEVRGVDVGLRRPRTGPPRHEPGVPVWRHPGTPYVLPWLAGCTLCMKCAAVCPTGALEVPEGVEEDGVGATFMGRAVVDEKICLPYNRVSWCGACYTACPLKETAIRVDYRNRPEVLEGCVGCGLCVEACPIRYKAIAVRPPFGPDHGEVRAE